MAYHKDAVNSKRKSVKIDDSHSVSSIRSGTAKNVCDTSG